MRLTFLTAAALLPLLAAAEANPPATYPAVEANPPAPYPVVDPNPPASYPAAVMPTVSVTSTAYLTKTITVSEVVTSVYATYPSYNTTVPTNGPTVVNKYVPSGTAPGAPANTLPGFTSAANSLSGSWVGGAGLVACAVAMML